MTCGHGSMTFYGNVAFAAEAMWGDGHVALQICVAVTPFT